MNSTANTLSIVPVELAEPAVPVPLGGTTPTPVGVSAREGVAIVPLGLDNAVAVVDLRTGHRHPHDSAAGELRRHRLGDRGRLDRLRRQPEPQHRLPGQLPHRRHLRGRRSASTRQGLVFTRGKVFVLNGNLDRTSSPAGPSWLTVIDPATNARGRRDRLDRAHRATGNAAFAAVGADGLLYVMNTGDYFSGEGRLSVVDPARAHRGGRASPASAPAPATWPPTRDARIFVSSLHAKA